MSQITLHTQDNRPGADVISLEQVIKRKVQRRRRVAKRLARRCPLFAVQEMQAEFPGYTIELFEQDISRKSRKGKSYRRQRSPMSFQGRYPLMKKALLNYQQTKDPEYLYQAQQLRKRMYSRFEVVFFLPTGKKIITLRSTTSVRFVESLSKIKFQTEEELDRILEEKMQWSHLS